MYNYFMVIGIVEEYRPETVKVKVQREFGEGYDILPLKLMVWSQYVDGIEEKLAKGNKVTIKGRMLAKADGSVELVAERIFV